MSDAAFKEICAHLRRWEWAAAFAVAKRENFGTEERKQFECWTVRDECGSPNSFRNRDNANRWADSAGHGPAIHMIAATPLTNTAGEMYEALELAILVLEALPEDDESLYGPRALTLARAALAKARGEP